MNMRTVFCNQMVETNGGKAYGYSEKIAFCGTYFRQNNETGAATFRW